MLTAPLMVFLRDLVDVDEVDLDDLFVDLAFPITHLCGQEVGDKGRLE